MNKDDEAFFIQFKKKKKNKIMYIYVGGTHILPILRGGAVPRFRRQKLKSLHPQ